MRRRVGQLKNHEQPRITLKSLIQKRPRDAPRFVRQQLRFDPVDPGRLLESFDHVGQQLEFDLARIWNTGAVRHEQIADHSLAAFIHEEAVAEDAATFDGGVSGKDFRVYIPQDHLRRSVIVP